MRKLSNFSEDNMKIIQLLNFELKHTTLLLGLGSNGIVYYFGEDDWYVLDPSKFGSRDFSVRNSN